MKIRVFIAGTLLSILGAGFMSCLSFERYYHKTYIYGEIVEINDRSIVFCIGERKNVYIGQELKVYRKVAVRLEPGATGHHKSAYPPNTRMMEVGRIKVVEYMLDRYAKAVVINGSISPGDTVDVNRQ
ncbi:MAG TPA: hypothetical protein PKM65_20605 [Spirochaetota bacterium]|nr:hypothetical protein [Spirochaetota bacterium]HNT13205.1 hypothetical protein [Spirochaetota bacterium]